MIPATSPTAIDMGLSVEKMEKVAFILKTTAHPTRIAIVQLLAAHDSLSVSNISERLSVEQSLLSHHLSGMKLKGILSSTRDGKNIYYALKMREVIDEVDLRQKANNIQTKRQELAARLHHSLHEKLMPLTADVLVCPAHGARSLCCKALSWANISSIGAEKAGNPMLPPLSEKDFVYANGHGREKYRGQPLQPLLHGARETKRPIHTNFA